MTENDEVWNKGDEIEFYEREALEEKTNKQGKKSIIRLKAHSRLI